MSDREIHSTTQAFLEVYDITNDMVILKDGTVSVILQIGTMNFSLLAEQEQDAVIFTYGSLLNSLNFPVQINIQSQTKDATKYLRLLDEQIQKAGTQQKANLIKRYQAFVSELIKERNVLEKKFYVVIPASPTEMGLLTAQSVIPGKTQFDITAVERTVILEKAANILDPRRDHIISQFNRLGLFAQQLNTQEIIRNFYLNYNPEATEGQEIGNSDSYTTPLVRASFSKNLMQSIQENSTPGYKVAESITLPPEQNQLAQQAQLSPDQNKDLSVSQDTQAQEIMPESSEVEPQISKPPFENTVTSENEVFPEKVEEQKNLPNFSVLSQNSNNENQNAMNQPEAIIPEKTGDSAFDAPGLQFQTTQPPTSQTMQTAQPLETSNPNFQDLSPKPNVSNTPLVETPAQNSFQEEIAPLGSTVSTPIQPVSGPAPVALGSNDVSNLHLESSNIPTTAPMKAPAEL